MSESSENALTAVELLVGAGVAVCVRRCSASAILRLLRMFEVMVGFLVSEEVAEGTEICMGASLMTPASESVGV